MPMESFGPVRKPREEKLEVGLDFASPPVEMPVETFDGDALFFSSR
jgi:hypothetical protein